MGNKKFGKQQILLLIRAAFFIFYPAIFVTAFTGARMLVEEIAAKETLKLDGFVETLIILCVILINFVEVGGMRTGFLLTVLLQKCLCRCVLPVRQTRDETLGVLR